MASTRQSNAGPIRCRRGRGRSGPDKMSSGPPTIFLHGNPPKSFPRWHNPAPAWRGPNAPKLAHDLDQSREECSAKYCCRQRGYCFEQLSASIRGPAALELLARGLSFIRTIMVGFWPILGHPPISMRTRSESSRIIPVSRSTHPLQASLALNLAFPF
jgi:hypothetical protein